MRTGEKQVEKGSVSLRVATLLCLASLMTSTFAAAQTSSSDLQIAEAAVVRITATFGHNDIVNVGTGFAWLDSKHVVTALHVVAGADSIKVYSDEKKDQTLAKIESVNLKADLALLKLDKEIGLKPLKAAATTPKHNEEYTIWGYPEAVPTVQGDEIRFSAVRPGTSTMSSIVSEEVFKKSVGSEGYPSFEVQILRVGSIIRHGHSGAPICDKTGSVVGIADGGLNSGVSRINWAIPAMTYLGSATESFKDQPPTKRASSTDRMSATIGQPVDIKIPTAHTRTGTTGEAKPARDEVLHLSWSAPMSEILDTVPDDDLEQLQDLSADIDKNNFEKALIDVYEDYQTGATIAVPHGLTLSFNPKEHALLAESSDGKLKMIVQIVNNSSREEGMKAMQSFDAFIESLASWQKDPEQKDKLVDRLDQESYWSLDKVRIVPDEADSKSALSQMTANLIIDDNDFMGAAIFVADLPSLTEKDVELFQLLQACVMLSDFAKK